MKGLLTLVNAFRALKNQGHLTPRRLPTGNAFAGITAFRSPAEMAGPPAGGAFHGASLAYLSGLVFEFEGPEDAFLRRLLLRDVSGMAE